MIVAGLTIALSALSGQALAQARIPPPEAYNPVDANGVNLTSGTYSFSATPISIGPKSGGLTYARTFDVSVNDWRDNMAGMVNRAPFFGPGVKQPWYTVTMLGSSTVFEVVNGAFRLLEGDNATLVLNGTTYTYTTADGAVAVFDQSQSTYSPYIANEGLITSITRPNGEVLTFTYTSIGMTGGGTARRLQSVTNTFGYQLKFHYWLDGAWSNDWYRLKTVTALNNAVDPCDPAAASCTYSRTWPSLSFDASLTEQSVTDALGRVTRLFPIAGGLGIRRPTRTSGYDVTVQWSGDPQQVDSVSTATGTWTYAFPEPADPAAPIYTVTNTVTDPLAHTTSVASTSIEVDPVHKRRVNRLTSVTNALGKTTQYGYATKYQLQSITQPEGNKVQYNYDGLGRIYSVTRTPKDSTTPVTVTAATYPACTSGNLKTCHQPETVTDARGNVTTFTYDAAHGGVLTATSPAPSSGAVQPQSRTSYGTFQAWYKNSAGTLIAGSAVYLPTTTSQCATTASCAGSADEVKATVAYQAGSASAGSNLLPVSTTSGSGDGLLAATIATTYEVTGDVRTVDGPLPGIADTTRSYYDAMRQVTGVIGPDPDGVGGLLHRANRTSYDLDGRVTLSESGTATSQADGAMGSFAPLQRVATVYDSVGRKSQERLQSGGGETQTLTQYGYDAANRLICQAVRMNRAEFGSPPASACALDTPGPDGPDRITLTEYDAADRVADVVSGYLTGAQRVEKVVTYTDNGQEKTVADGKGNLTTYSYDGFDRLSAVRYPNAVCCTSSTSDYDAYGYDAAGNRTVWRKRDGQVVNFTYDALNRLSYRDDPRGWYYYDNLGRPTYTYAGALADKIVAHYHDALGRPTWTYDYRDGTWFPTYTGHDLAGRPTQLQWSDGFYVNYDYNVAGDMVGVRENGPTYLAVLGYDDLGRRTYLYRGNGVNSWNTYDDASRINYLSHDLAGTAQDQIWTYAYNASGQIKTRSSSNPLYDWTTASTPRSYTINGRNQATEAGSSVLTYDGRGNLTNDGGAAFGYDLDNRLTSATSGAGAATLSYDPLGRLGQTAREVTTRFVYSGQNLIAELDASNAILRRYVPGPGVDQTIVWYEGGGTGDRRWLLADERGSVVGAANAAAVATINLYDEYGIPAAGNQGRFQYTGQTWLPEVGLYHYKARVYSPTLGRFLQTDPIGYADGLNWYAYVGNDPLNGADPTGTQEVAPAIVEGCRQCWIEKRREEIARQSWESFLRDSFSNIVSNAPTLIPGYDLYNCTEESCSDGAGNLNEDGIGAFVSLVPFGRLLKRSAPCNCFEAGTLVTVSDGLKPIEKIEVGDLVLSRDDVTDQTAHKPVAALIPGQERQIWDVTFEPQASNLAPRRETIHTTEEHPFRTADGVWTPAAKLTTGAKVVTASGTKTVASVVRTDRVVRTYNLEIADFHTYFVGEGQLWVHNACDPSKSPIWKSLRNWRGKTKTDGNKFYEWDRTHGEIEVYNSRGVHIGVQDPITGNMIKPPVPGRTINVK